MRVPRRSQRAGDDQQAGQRKRDCGVAKIFIRGHYVYCRSVPKPEPRTKSFSVPPGLSLSVYKMRRGGKRCVCRDAFLATSGYADCSSAFSTMATHFSTRLRSGPSTAS